MFGYTYVVALWDTKLFITVVLNIPSYIGKGLKQLKNPIFQKQAIFFISSSAYIFVIIENILLWGLKDLFYTLFPICLVETI